LDCFAFDGVVDVVDFVDDDVELRVLVAVIKLTSSFGAYKVTAA